MYHQNRNKREGKSSEPGSNKNLDIRSRSSYRSRSYTTGREMGKNLNVVEGPSPKELHFRLNNCHRHGYKPPK